MAEIENEGLANEKPKKVSKPKPQKPKNKLKEVTLKKDLVTSKGVRKKGTKILTSDEGYNLLRQKGIV